MGKGWNGGIKTRVETRQAPQRQSLPPEGGGVIEAVAGNGPEGLEGGIWRAELGTTGIELPFAVTIFPKYPQLHNFT